MTTTQDARHPRVTYINAINGQSEACCYQDAAAAFDAMATERPFSNTLVSPGYCSEAHETPAPPDLPDPVHHGDAFSRIEASEHWDAGQPAISTEEQQ